MNKNIEKLEEFPSIKMRDLRKEFKKTFAKINKKNEMINIMKGLQNEIKSIK